MPSTPDILLTRTKTPTRSGGPDTPSPRQMSGNNENKAQRERSDSFSEHVDEPSDQSATRAITQEVKRPDSAGSESGKLTAGAEQSAANTKVDPAEPASELLGADRSSTSLVGPETKSGNGPTVSTSPQEAGGATGSAPKIVGVANTTGTNLVDEQSVAGVASTDRPASANTPTTSTASLAAAAATSGETGAQQQVARIGEQLGSGEAKRAEAQDDMLSTPAVPSRDSAKAVAATDTAVRPAAVPAPSIGVLASAEGTTGFSGDTSLALHQSRGPEWRLEAVAAAGPSGQGADARAAAQTSAANAVGQITVAMTKSRERSFEIRLDPPELGRVQITLDRSEDGLRVIVMAERAETQDMLRRNAELLMRDLRDAGFENASFAFEHGEHASSAEDEDAEHMVASAASQAGEHIAEQPHDAPDARTGLAAGGLDIRL